MTMHGLEQSPTVEADEGSWVYVSGPLQVADPRTTVGICEKLAEAAEGSGWQAYRSYRNLAEEPESSVPLIERLRYAVGHADVCLLYVGLPSSGVGAELAFACARKRPVIAVSLQGEQPSRVVSSLLANYSRARSVVGTDAQECGHQVKLLLADPEFVEIVREAAGEYQEHV